MEKSVLQGNPKFQYVFGLKILNRDFGYFSDTDKALNILEKAANKNYSDAQYELGIWYCDICESFGKSKNTKLGLKWLEDAANAGHLISQKKLGFLYAHGWPLSDCIHPFAIIDYIMNFKNWDSYIFLNPKASVKWLTKAAENGDTEAQHDLGLLYINGGLLKPDYGRRLSYEYWIHKFIAYITGVDVPKNIKTGIYWLTKAAEFSEYYQYKLGWYFAGDDDRAKGMPYNFPEDEKKAELWFIKAAESESRKSDKNLTYQYELARRYLWGWGIRKNFPSAKFWFEKCLEIRNDYIGALYYLGEIYADGLGIKNDPHKADKIFSTLNAKDTDFDSFYILFNLISRYADGNGVPNNQDKALHFIKLFSYWIDIYKEKPDLNRVLLKQFCEKIANRFKQGKGIPMDFEKAEFWLVKAKSI